MVSATTSKGWPGTWLTAWWTTPGPEMPTLMTHSGSPGPWKAPAMKGLSSTALAKTTSLAQPKPPWAAVRSAADLMTRPISATASMLIPALVEPTFTEEHTRSVVARASGMEAMSFRSEEVKPFWTRAEKPPMKSMPTVLAALSRALAKGT